MLQCELRAAIIGDQCVFPTSNKSPLSDTRQDGNGNGDDDDDRARQHKGRMGSNLRYRFDTGTKLKICVTVSGLCVLLILAIAMPAALLNKGNSYKWNDWSPWQPCPVTCGSGVQHRTRSCNTTEVGCEGLDRETQNCMASPSLPCPPDPVCFQNYTTLSESYRRESVPRSPYNCERIDETSWYRFQLVSGENGVINHCPRWYTCGTEHPVWMDDTHPEEFGEIKQVTMYGSTKGAGSGTCFTWSGSALVTKCLVDGDIFYLYQLWDPGKCAWSYCTSTYDIP